MTYRADLAPVVFVDVVRAQQTSMVTVTELRRLMGQLQDFDYDEEMDDRERHLNRLKASRAAGPVTK